MPFTLPKELQEKEWKKHKAALATETGISKALIALQGLANAYSEDDADSIRALVKGLLDMSRTAKTAEGKVGAVFPKTKEYLGKMATKAAETGTKVNDEWTQRIKNEISREKAVKLNALLQAKQALEDAVPKGITEYFKVMSKNHDALGIKLGDIIKMEKSAKAGDQDAVTKILGEHGIPIGQGIKIIQIDGTKKKK